MIPLIIPIGALLTGVGFLLLGSGLLNTLIAIRGGIEGYSDSLLGIIMSGYFIGFFVGTFLALPLIKRIGHIRTFAFCAAITAITALLHVLIINVVAWMFFRILMGTALVILYTVIESWLNGQTPAQQRGRVFAIYMIVNLGALAIAQQLLRFGSPSTFVLFACASILMAISLIPVTWTRLAQPEISEVSRLSFKRLYRAAPIAVAGAILSGLAMGAFWGMGALYAKRIGMDTEGIAMFMSCAIIGGAIFQYPLGRYSDTHDRRRVLAVVCGLAAIVALIMAFSSQAHTLLLVSISIYGGLAFSLYPITVAHLIDNVDTQDILAGGSGLLLLHGIGAAFGPALAGQLMDGFGANALPVYFSVMQFCLMASTVYYLHNTIAEVPAEHAGHFVPMVRTTPTMLEMHPDDQEAPPETNAVH